MDTGATRSCMNYSTAYKLGKNDVKQFETTQVVGADGSDLGAVGTLQCKVIIGDIEVEQTFMKELITSYYQKLGFKDQENFSIVEKKNKNHPLFYPQKITYI